jgi:hypothetical protein
MDAGIPIGHWSIGLDPLIGLIPGVGDLIGAVTSLVIAPTALPSGISSAPRLSGPPGNAPRPPGCELWRWSVERPSALPEARTRGSPKHLYAWLADKQSAFQAQPARKCARVVHSKSVRARHTGETLAHCCPGGDSAAAACPQPLPSEVNSAGAESVTGSEIAPEVLLGYRTTISAVSPEIAYGTTAAT